MNDALCFLRGIFTLRKRWTNIPTTKLATHLNGLASLNSSIRMVLPTFSLKHGELYVASITSISKNGCRDEYIAPIPEPERTDMILAYHAQLNSVDEEVILRAAKAWQSGSE